MTKPTSIKLDDDLKSRVEHLAEAWRRTSHWITREAITQYVEREEKRELRDELFPAEQARIVHLLVERVEVRMHGVEVRLRPNGLTGLVNEVVGNRRAAA